MGDVGSYVGSIDFRLAALVALAVGVAATLVRMFILATADEGLSALPIVGAWLARSALARRRDLATRSWFCSACRSLNPPSAKVCYRGCGPREALDVGELPSDELIDARSGTSRRRG